MKKDKNLNETQGRIIKNLRFLRTQKEYSQEKMADILHLTTTQYQNYELGLRAVPTLTLMDISNHFNIVLDAIVKGDLTKVDFNGIFPVNNNRILFPIVIKEGEEQDPIQVVPIKASAGYLKGYGDPMFIESLPTMKLPFLKTDTYRSFTITGDSMLPVVSGSMVVGKFVHEISEIKNGKTYIVVTLEGISYKRVEREGNALILISDNSFYEPYLVPLEEVRELWEFACLITTQELDKQAYSESKIYPLISGVYNNMSSLTDDIAEIKRKLSGIQ